MILSRLAILDTVLAWHLRSGIVHVVSCCFVSLWCPLSFSICHVVRQLRYCLSTLVRLLSKRHFNGIVYCFFIQVTADGFTLVIFFVTSIISMSPCSSRAAGNSFSACNLFCTLAKSLAISLICFPRHSLIMFCRSMASFIMT